MNNNIIRTIFSKIILYGLPIFYILVAVAFYLKTYDSAQIKITIAQIGGVFLIFSWIVLKLETDLFSYIRKNFIVILPIVLFLFSGIFSYICSPFQIISSNELIRRIIYCFLAIIIIDSCRNKTNIKYLFISLIIITYIVVFYSLIQYIDVEFFPAPPEKGLDPFSWRWTFGKRVFSTFGNPNLLGDFLIVVSPFILSLFLKSKKILLLLLWILVFFCVVVSSSKGAWLGFGIGLIIFIFIYLTFIIKTSKNKKNISLAILMFIIILAITMGVSRQLKHRPDSSVFRMFTWMSTWEMINTHPVLGTGIGTFYLTYPAYRRPQIFYIENVHNNETDHPENEYLEVFYDEGAIGLGLFLLLLSMALVVGFRNINYLKKCNKQNNIYIYIQAAAISALIAQIIHNFFCVSLRFVSSGIMLWMLIGLVLTIALRYANKQCECNNYYLPKYIKYPIYIILFLITVYLINIFVNYFIADKLHLESIKISNEQNYSLAIQKYSKVIEKNPTFVMPIYFKINNSIEQNFVENKEYIIKLYKELWKKAPNYVQSKYMAGYFYSLLWEYYNAVAIQAVNNKDKAQFDIAILNREDSFNKMIKYFNQYKQLDPIFFYTYDRLAQIYLQMGDIEKAKKEYADYLQFPFLLAKKPYNLYEKNWIKMAAKEYVKGYIELGNILYRLNNIKEAENMYDKSMDIVITAEALKSLMVIYSRNKDSKNYDKAFATLKKLYPRDPYLKEIIKNSQNNNSK